MDDAPLCRHYVSVSLAQLSATIFRKEGLEAWPQFSHLLQQSTHSAISPEREVRSRRQAGGTEKLDRGPCVPFSSHPLLLDRWGFCC